MTFEEALSANLAECVGGPVHLSGIQRLGGGASQEVWRVDARTGPQRLALVVRRELGGRMFKAALNRREEFDALRLAHAHGVPAPQPYWYLPDLLGRPAFVMARLEGETVGRRIVRDAGLTAARAVLATQMARALASIHRIPLADAGFLPGPAPGQDPVAWTLDALAEELAGVAEPYPVLELGLRWLREHAPQDVPVCVCHGDFRVGNVVVDRAGLVGVLDWEFAHRGAAGADLGFGMIRAWRFGAAHLHYGGVGAAREFLAAYNAASGRHFSTADGYYWEVHGNVKWALATLTQARRHLHGMQPSLELASLGRVTAEVELELLSLINPRHPRYPY